ncbi:MAG TPA: D-2-hydroxyacid dehydrogenase [Chitinophagales bacterium]|nr:D-2-hydroxyacid dehydrogenase [Chitinophagales bacterium]
MIKILANDGIEPSAKAALEKEGYEVITQKIPQEELPKRINEFDALTVRSATKVRKPLVDVITRTKLIIRGGVGVDNIDVEYAQSKGITVKNTPRASSLSVAELVFAHLFGAIRFLPDSNRQMPVNGISQFNELKKNYSGGTELRGKTLGLLGFGNIGQETAKIALGIGMNVKACDPFVKEAALKILIAGEEVEIVIATVSKEELLYASDFISIHAAGSQEVLTAEDFSVMKTGVGIINCARGGLVKESVMIENLDSGKVAFAGLDVYEEEPTKNSLLLNHPKVSLTPHIGASTKEAQERIGKEIVEIIMGFFKKTEDSRM